MDYKTFLTASALDHKMELIDKAIEYMETVPVSTECHDAIVDMLKYEKEGIAEDFRQLTCESCIENYKRAQHGNQGIPGKISTRPEGFVMGMDGTTHAPEGMRFDSRDIFAVHC